MELHEGHQKFCASICKLEEIEWEKKKKALVCGVDAEKLPLKLKKKLVRLVGARPTLKFLLGGLDTEGLWDTGAMVSLLNETFVQENFPEAKIETLAEFLGNEDLKLTAANKKEMSVIGIVVLKFGIAGTPDMFEIPFLVTDEPLSQPILGYNTIEYLVSNFGNSIDLPASMVSLFGSQLKDRPEVLVNIVEAGSNISELSHAAKVQKRQVLSPGCVLKVRCKFGDLQLNNPVGKIIVFSPFEEFCVEKELSILETTEKLTKNRKFVDVIVHNPNLHEVVLEKGTVIGSVSDVAAAFPLPMLLPEEKRDGAEVGEVQVEIGAEVEEVPAVWSFDLDHLNEEQKQIALQMLSEESEAFAKSKYDIGHIKDFKLEIKLTDDIPVVEPYRKIPPSFYQEVKDHIHNLLANGWIRQSFSQYSSPMVCARKKCGGLRLCIDYRKINLKTIPDRQPIPRIQDILDSLHGNTWFSTLDMSQAYHQGTLHEDARKFTAFSTPWSLYEWIRIPYGIMNAPPGFQRFIFSCLANLIDQCCKAYLDDVLVYSKDFEGHVESLRSTLRCFIERGVKLNPSKCCLFKKEVKYLGRLISAKGYRPDPENTRALDKCLEPPKTVGQLRSLIGFLGYYRTYVKDFSIKLKTVYDLLQVENPDGTRKPQKNQKQLDSRVKIKWTAEHQKVIEEMVAHLKSPAVIAYPDFSQPFVVHCDASQLGLGAVLYQKQEGETKVISFASRTLSPAEKNYHLHSGKLEFLALKWSVGDRWRDYLIGGPEFDVITDNNPLTYVLTTARLNATGLRWVSELANFNFKIKYRQGRTHIDADYLSRHPIAFEDLQNTTNKIMTSDDVNIIFSTASRRESAVNNVEILKSPSCNEKVTSKQGKSPTAREIRVASLAANVASQQELISNDELSKAQKNDEIVGPVFDIILKQKELSRGEIKLLSKDSKTLLRQKWKLGIENNVLVRRTKTLRQIILPECYHRLVFLELHEKLAHLGSEKTWELARRRFYWANMQRSIEHFIRKKCRCIKSKKPPVLERAPLVPIVATCPFEFLSMDYMHLDRGKGGYEYALVLIDHFTRFAQIYPTKKNDGISAADKLFNEFVLKWGLPLRIHTDQGSEFENKLFRRLQQLTGVEKSRTTPYHPEGNSKSERFNRSIINMLKTLEEKEKSNWPKHLAKIAFAHNVTVNKATGYSPYYLMFGRSARLPVDDIFGIDASEGDVKMRKSWKQYAEDWQDSMNQAFEIARKHCIASNEQNKKNYDKRVKGADIEVGERVLYRNREKGGTGKLRSFWENRVFVVTGKEEEIPVYSIKPEKGAGKVKRVHRNDIMTCNEILSEDDVEEIREAEKRKRSAPKSGKKTTATPEKSAEEGSNQQHKEKEGNRESDDTDDEFVLLEGEDDEIVSRGESLDGDAVDGVSEANGDATDDEEPQVRVTSETEVSEQEKSSDAESIPLSEAENPSEGLENDADSESSDSNFSTPPPRRGNRIRAGKSVFTYNEFGNPTVIRHKNN